MAFSIRVIGFKIKGMGQVNRRTLMEFIRGIGLKVKGKAQDNILL